jgi:type III secretion protein U
MSDSGEKTEQPTAKRLRDARRDGDVPKSQDLNHTLTTLVWTLLLAGLSGFAADRVGSLLDFAWTQTDLSSPTALRDVGIAALKTFALLTLLPLGIVALCGVFAEFLQVGAIVAPKRIMPQGSRLSPANGFKRMFSSENFFELAKGLFKTLLLSAVLIWLMKHYLPDIMRLPAAGLQSYIGLDQRMLLMLGTCIVVLFAFVSIADRLFQTYSHRKRLRMSKSDVKREHKEDQGDPQLRGQRKRLHRQWSAQDAREAARNATALLVNPTHIAIAILYDPEQTAVPTITAKGEGHLARLMRREAEDAGVPIVRDVPLARTLNFCADEDDFIPEEFFDAIAEVLAWAERMRRERALSP